MKKHLFFSYFGFLKTLIVVLLVTVILQSCDMGKYYFRMHPGGKNHPSPKIAHHEFTSLSPSVSEEKVPLRIDSDSLFEDLQFESVSTETNEDNFEQTVNQNNTVNIQSKPTNGTNKHPSHEQVKSKRQKTSSSLSSWQEIVLIICGAVMLIVLGIAIATFLVSWIFAPIMLALKIALWTFCGLTLVPIIIAIALLCS